MTFIGIHVRCSAFVGVGVNRFALSWILYKAVHSLKERAQAGLAKKNHVLQDLFYYYRYGFSVALISDPIRDFSCVWSRLNEHDPHTKTG